MKTSTLMLAAAILLFTSCAIRPIGYFETQPYAKPIEPKISVPLAVVMKEDVQDQVTVSGLGTQKMAVSEFRNTVKENLNTTFNQNFDYVNFPGKNPDKGLVLVIYRIRPYWGSSSVISAHDYGFGTYSRADKKITAVFQYESSLFYNGEKIGHADGEAHSEGDAYYTSEAHPVFENGMRVMCESIDKNLLTDEVVTKMRKLSSQ